MPLYQQAYHVLLWEHTHTLAHALQNSTLLRHNYFIIDLFFIQILHNDSESGFVRIERKHPQVIEIILGASSTGPRDFCHMRVHERQLSLLNIHEH